MKVDPYKKLRRAHERNRGTNLSADDVDKLMDDTAIYDAVMQTYADDNDDAPERNEGNDLSRKRTR